jgi:hypothetical protein
MEPVRINSSLPALTDTESAAAPAAQPEASLAAPAVPATGGEARLFQPDVVDEALVAFEHGDPRAPYVTGELWNSQMPPADAGNASGQENDRFSEERAKLLNHQLKKLE